ncbi:TetR/AcrR family transcriptional regulator [Saccharicrinis sp. FJH54]|uniref:TetR/AcrR family transcriptional regulator n=1 Tax=Saccharicrinis sp. FJH54 TaxID=3344665 RepID=UPI0035D4F6A2
MQDTKSYILKTSLVLFLQKSFKEVTMNEIVGKTGLSKGAFYHYFKSKEELYKEIVSMFFSLGSVDYASFDQGSLYHFCTDYIEHTEASFKQIYALTGIVEKDDVNLNFMMIMFEAIKKFPEFLKMEYALYEKSSAAWITVIDKAKKSGEIKSDTPSKIIADTFLYLTDGVFIRFINSDKFDSYSEGLKEAFNAVYENLKA